MEGVKVKTLYGFCLSSCIKFFYGTRHGGQARRRFSEACELIGMVLEGSITPLELVSMLVSMAVRM